MCDGCLTYDEDDAGNKIECFVENFIIDPDLCPCKDCIIKPMCLSACEEFSNLNGPHLQESFKKRWL